MRSGGRIAHVSYHVGSNSDSDRFSWQWPPISAMSSSKRKHVPHYMYAVGKWRGEILLRFRAPITTSHAVVEAIGNSGTSSWVLGSKMCPFSCGTRIRTKTGAGAPP